MSYKYMRVTYRISEHGSPQSWVHEKCDPGLAGLTEKLKEGEGGQQSLRRYRRADGELGASKIKYSAFSISIREVFNFSKRQINLTWQRSLLVRGQESIVNHYFFGSKHSRSKPIVKHPQSRSDLELVSKEE